jgi:hypothetical protein
MRIFTNHLQELNGRRGLYCVWVPAPPGSATPLVARWIDPQADRRDEQTTAKVSETQDPGPADRQFLRVA